jgi:hypothetical protein
MENSANIMRIALILSIIAHVVFVTFSARDLRPTAHGEAMTVDLVPANEAPSGPTLETKDEASAAQAKDAKPELKAAIPSSSQATAPPPKVESKTNEAKIPEAKAAETKIAQAPTATAAKPTEQKPPQPQPQQFPPEQKPPQPSQTSEQPTSPDPQQTGPREMRPDPNRLAQMLGLPFSGNFESGGDDSGGEREPMVKFTEGVKELKAQLRRCFKLPAGVAANQRVRTVIRIRLKQDGTLASDPEPWEYAASEFGPAMMQSVMRALRQCAPYNLPPDKYKEWRVLDIDFSPDQMTGS